MIIDFRNTRDNFFHFHDCKKKSRRRRKTPLSNLSCVSVYDPGRELSSSPFFSLRYSWLLFLFWIYNRFQNLSRGTCPLCVCSVGPWRTVLCERKTKGSFRFVFVVCVFNRFHEMPNRIGEEWCSRRTLSLLNFYEHSNELQNLFQVSTVNRIFLLFVLLVCFLLIRSSCEYYVAVVPFIGVILHESEFKYVSRDFFFSCSECRRRQEGKNLDNSRTDKKKRTAFNKCRRDSMVFLFPFCMPRKCAIFLLLSNDEKTKKILTQSAVSSIPSLWADTSAILALSMFGAPSIARQLIAKISNIARITATFSRFTHSVRSTIQAANGY